MSTVAGFTFGEWLRQFRVRAELSRQELADEIGVHLHTVSAWERGDYLPRNRDRVLELAQALVLGNRDTDLLLIAAGYPPAQQAQETELASLTLQDAIRHPPEIPHYLMPLDRYLRRSRSPKLSDFEEDLIYLPEHYIAAMTSRLEQKHRLLLVGQWASGKTVLAIALSKRFQETENYKVMYADITGAREGDGQLWYQALRAHDHKRALYILDNCHLAPEEASEFCSRWEELPPRQVLCILISRVRADEAAVPGDDYFDMWADVSIEVRSEELFRGVLEKHEAAYRRKDPDRYVPLQDDTEAELRKQHSHNLVISRCRLETWREAGGRLSDVRQEDVYEWLRRKYLEKAEARETLLPLCALWQYEIPVHNRFVERSLPQDEVRQLVKGKLLSGLMMRGYGTLYQLTLHSAEAREIFEAGIYRQLGRVDESLVMAEAIDVLRTYLKAKPSNYIAAYNGLYRQQQTAVLRALLSDRDLQECAASQFGTGSISDIALYIYNVFLFDPLRAQELLHACVQALSLKEVCSRLLTSSFWYIGMSLWWIRKVDEAVAREIVAEIDIQQLGQQNKRESLVGLYWFLRALKTISPMHTKQLLDGISLQALVAQATTGTMSSFRGIVETLQELEYPPAQVETLVKATDVQQLAQRDNAQGLQSFSWFIRTLKAISPAQTKQLLESIPTQVLATRLSLSDLSSVIRVIEALQELAYPSAQLETLVQAIDVQRLVHRAATQNLQKLYLLAHRLKDISLDRAKALLESIPVEILAAKITASAYSSSRDMLETLRELGYPPTRLEVLVNAVDMQQLAHRAATQGLQHLYWLLRTFKGFAPRATDAVLETITPAGLASVCRMQAATIQTIDLFSRVSSRDFWRHFFQQFTQQDLAEIFDRSPLGQIGTFFQYKYLYDKESYRLFQGQSLTKKLANEPLKEVGKFIHRIGQIPQEGTNLAREILDLLVTVDMTGRIASTDLEPFALLLYSAKSIDEGYPSKLLEPLWGRPEILHQALEQSGIHGIALFIPYLASADRSFLQDLQQALRTASLTDKLAIADVKDIGYFLWNVCAYIEPGMAQQYCRLVDAQQRPVQLGKAPLETLCSFLWNLFHLSNLPQLQTASEPTVKERLLAAWKSEIGLGAELLGILATSRPEIAQEVPLPPIETQEQREQLVAWLVQVAGGKNPYALALALRGLRIHSELEAQTLVRSSPHIPEITQLLQDARASAITTRSVELLQETLEWLRNGQTD